MTEFVILIRHRYENRENSRENANCSPQLLGSTGNIFPFIDIHFLITLMSTVLFTDNGNPNALEISTRVTKKQIASVIAVFVRDACKR